MLSLQKPSIHQSSKCYFTHGIIGHLDPKQPPSKGKPWNTFAGQDFIHRADLIVPEEAFEAVNSAIVQNRPAPEFKRVVMSLRDVLSGDFFREYIQNRNVMMLSQGRIGIDDVYSLRDGVLTMFLDREAYERAGLVGKPHGVKGDRGLKPRWIVEYDLKSDSMAPGKKGFDRLVYASKNFLNTPVAWLFCNVTGTVPIPDPLLPYSPINHISNPEVARSTRISLPHLKPALQSIGPGDREDLESFSAELYEWISLVRLGSPRIHPEDNIDPFLSRYEVPGAKHQGKLRTISWRGFLPPAWSRGVLVDVIAALPSKTWFSFSTTTFTRGVASNNSDCTILRPPDSQGEYLMWEIKSHE